MGRMGGMGIRLKAGLLAVLLLMAVGAFAQGPLPQIGSLPRGGGSSSQISNIVFALELWTNDVFGDLTVLRPVNTARTLSHQMVSSNYNGINLSLLRTNNSDGYSIAAYFYNQATNAGAATTYWGLGKYGVVGESADTWGSLFAGDAAGVLGVSDGYSSAQYGTVGFARSRANVQTNIGVKGIAVNAGNANNVIVGGYFEVSPTSGVTPTPQPPNSAALVANSLSASFPNFEGQSNGVPYFRISQSGDLTMIDGVTYDWPITQGAANTFLKNNGSGTLSWGSSGVGPGTNNFLAKFDSTTLNVVGANYYSDTTNSFELRQNFNPANTYTNSATNRMYGEWTSTGNNQYMEWVVPKGHNNEVGHFRTFAVGQTSQRAPIVINDAIQIEPITDQLGGHSAGAILPMTGSAGAGLQTIGISTAPFLDVWATRVFGTTGLNSGPQFGTGVGGTGFGITTDNTMLQFFRSTGITAAFNKEENSGSLQFDLAGNYLGFGSGISNTVAFLGGNDQVISAMGELGLVQVGTNNNNGTSAVAAQAGLIGAPGVGTDKGGTPLRLSAGAPSGNATGGKLLFATSGSGASGSTIRGITNRMEIAPDTGTVTIYSNLVVNGSISAAGTGGSGLGTLFTNNQYSVSFDSAGRLTGTNYVAASLGWTLGTNGSANLSSTLTTPGGVGVGVNVNQNGEVGSALSGSTGAKARFVSATGATDNSVRLLRSDGSFGYTFNIGGGSSQNFSFLGNANQMTMTGVGSTFDGVNWFNATTNNGGTLILGNALQATNGIIFPQAVTQVQLTNVVYTNVTLNFPSTAATSFSDLALNTANLKSNDVATISVPAISQTNGMFTTWISNTTHYARYHNIQATAVDPASGIFNIQVFQYK